MVLTLSNAAEKATEFLEMEPAAPTGEWHGRGIVTCGGGIRYGACSWVLIRLLRHLGCDLPIEVWSLDDEESDPEWEALVAPYNVRCVNARIAPRPLLPGEHAGWRLKSHAVLYSRFREVLFLDADNVPTRNPEYLFESPQYRLTGTVFWPDPEKFSTSVDSARWEVFGVPYRPGPDQESGQLLINKERCHRALQLCNWYNTHSDFFYRHVYGDKDTFRYAWHRLEQPISWPGRYASEDLYGTLCQHDFHNEVLFQHRFWKKWSLYGRNPRIPGFQHEQLCLSFLDELRRQWDPTSHLVGEAKPERSKQSLAGRRFDVRVSGRNRWRLCLGADQRITEGRSRLTNLWWQDGDALVLADVDGRYRTKLYATDEGVWESRANPGGSIHMSLTPCVETAA